MAHPRAIFLGTAIAVMDEMVTADRLPFVAVLAIPLLFASGPQEPRDVAPRTTLLHKGHINLSTGLYIREDDDLVIDGVAAVGFRRTYLSGDHVSRAFGIGTTHTGELYLRGDGEQFSWAELILANGGRIRFARISPGRGWLDAVFRHDSTPTEYSGAHLRWIRAYWELRKSNGDVLLFQGCGPYEHNICSIVESRDAEGRSVQYLRESSGRLFKIRSGDQAIEFQYDSSNRITAAIGTNGRRVDYEYDERGRLVQVRASDGTTRKYTYSDRDEMLTIDEPGWFIANSFDDHGRAARQVTRWSDGDTYTTVYKYTLVDGQVAAMDFTEDDEARTHYEFNAAHYVVAATYDAGSHNPARVAYDRDATTNRATSATLRCNGPDGPIVRTITVDPFRPERREQEAIRRMCVQ